MIKKIYEYITHEKRIEKYRKIYQMIGKILGEKQRERLNDLKYKLHYEKIGILNEEKLESPDTYGWNFEKVGKRIENPLVSVIVPNYNHAPFLVERLESIYNQTYKNIEVILLDDCSNDNSKDILNDYAKKYTEKTITLFNEKNGGRVFKQWNKGLNCAKGDLIWIAESDDYCELDFLEKMVELFCYDSVMLAFSRSVFMQNGERIWSTEEYLHDLQNLKWNKPFYMSANELVENGFAIHNIIPNVSSAVFRNTGSIPDEVQNICGNMQLSGDWIFYLNMIKGSVVAYTNATTNYYRIHPQSTSLKIQKTEDYYKEFEEVSCYIARNYKISEETFRIILENLKEHYQMQGEHIDGFKVDNYYSISKIINEMEKRKPNIIMACYALRSGGGETFPIYLANEMKSQGYSITLLNFDYEPCEERIVSLVNKDVPIVNMKHTDYIGNILHHLGGEIVHSHHASVDYALSLWIESNPKLSKQIITLHGMYESINKEDCDRVIKQTWKTCCQYAYVADKNLLCFKEIEYYNDEKFVKVPNGLPQITIEPIKRSALNIDEDDFIFVLASRGIAEKGWDEAIKATTIANELGERKIQLVILGDGEVKQTLEKNAPDYVHFVGTVSNVRDYFALGDAGILPSRFKGESYPLVIIECLMTGKPVISTAIAEVPNQIIDKKGNSAGLLVELNDWKIDIRELATVMAKLANDKALYAQLKNNTFSVSEKFSIEKIVEKYVKVYCKTFR